MQSTEQEYKTLYKVWYIQYRMFECDLRLQGLEKKILIEAGETPAVVYEMKKQVDSFREKLEVRN